MCVAEAIVFELQGFDVFSELDDLFALGLELIALILDVFDGPVKHFLLELQLLGEQLPPVSLIEYIVGAARL